MHHAMYHATPTMVLANKHALRDLTARRAPKHTVSFMVTVPLTKNDLHALGQNAAVMAWRPKKEQPEPAALYDVLAGKNTKAVDLATLATHAHKLSECLPSQPLTQRALAVVERFAGLAVQARVARAQLMTTRKLIDEHLSLRTLPSGLTVVAGALANATQQLALLTENEAPTGISRLTIARDNERSNDARVVLHINATITDPTRVGALYTCAPLYTA